MGQGPKIVGAECRSNHHRMSQQHLGKHFIIGVGLRFLFEERNWPASLLIANGIRIPVRPLHQADGHRSRPLADPREEIIYVALRLSMIGLEREPHMGKGAIHWLRKKASK